MLRFVWNSFLMLLLCGIAMGLWYLWPPLAVPVFLLIVGICNSDDLLSSAIRPRDRHR